MGEENKYSKKFVDRVSYRALYQDLFFRTTDCIFIVKPEDGVIVEITPSCEFHFGRDESFFVGKTIYEFSGHKDELKKIFRQCRRCYYPRKYTFHFSIEKDIYILEASISVLELSNGEVYMQMASQDITEKIRLQKEKEEMQIGLIKSEKLAALGRIAGEIFHEFNNPLTIVLGKLEILSLYLEKDEVDKKEIKKYIESISNASERIVSTLNNFKIFENVKDKTFKKEQIITLWDEAFYVYKKKSSLKNLSIECDPNIENKEIFCIKNELAYVMTGLVENAIDVVGDNKNSWVKVKLGIDNDFFIFSVIDSGTKISEKIAENLFLPFFTTKSFNKGRGLGLSICKKIIEEHQGTIYYDKEASNTTFIFKIPLYTNRN